MSLQSVVVDLDRQSSVVNGQINRLRAAASSLQGIAYSVQVDVETPVDRYDAGGTWQGDKREEFESKKREAKKSVDELRRDIDSARSAIDGKINQLQFNLFTISNERSQTVGLIEQQAAEARRQKEARRAKDRRRRR